MTRKIPEKDSHIIEEVPRAEKWRTFPEIIVDLCNRNNVFLFVIDFSFDIFLVEFDSIVVANFLEFRFVVYDKRFIIFLDDIITIVVEDTIFDIFDNNFFEISVFVTIDNGTVTDAVFFDLAKANIPIQRIILDDTFPIGCRAVFHEEPHVLFDPS